MYNFTSTNIKEDAIAMSWNHSRGMYIKTLIFLLVIDAGASVSVFLDIHNKKNLILGLIAIIGTILILVSLYLGIRKAPLRNAYIRKTKEIKLTFGEDKIESLTIYDDGEGKGECTYDKIIKVKEDRKRIYCYLTLDSALILNKKCLNDVNEFKSFLKNKVNKYVI